MSVDFGHFILFVFLFLVAWRATQYEKEIKELKKKVIEE